MPSLTLAPDTRQIVAEMLSSERYRRAWPDGTFLYAVGNLWLSAATLYTATRMVREGRTPAARAGEPLFTAWALAVALNESQR